MSQWGALDAKYSTGAGANQRIDVPTCQQCLNGQCTPPPEAGPRPVRRAAAGGSGCPSLGHARPHVRRARGPQSQSGKDLGDFGREGPDECAASAAKDREKALKRKRKGLGEEARGSRPPVYMEASWDS